MAKGPVICAATGVGEWAINECKAYIARFGLTRDDVRLIQEGDMTLVVAKRDCSEKLVDTPHNTT